MIDAVQRADNTYASTLRTPSLMADGLDDVVHQAATHGFKELVHAYVPAGNNQQLIAQLTRDSPLAGCVLRPLCVIMTVWFGPMPKVFPTG